MKNTFYSNGKLLLTGEYVVLDGALSLAIPTKFGQSLTIEEINKPKLIWKSLDKKKGIWFEEELFIEQIASSQTPLNDVSKRLLQILNATLQLNPDFLNHNGFKVTTQLDFDKDWGLGTSSTLINNIANWANVDAYKLLEFTFGGSGYDIACAQHNVPITYQLTRPFNCAQGDNVSYDKKIEIREVNFNPIIKDYLYFVHLNKKQNSRDGIVKYEANKSNSTIAISEISDITSKIIECTSLKDFETLITVHEQIISKVIKQKPIKELYFKDFEGSIKSLGAWGGDFVLVTSKDDPKTYFKNKGFNTIIPYKKMVLNKKGYTF